MRVPNTGTIEAGDTSSSAEFVGQGFHTSIDKFYGESHRGGLERSARKGSVRLAIDYLFVNSHSQGGAFVMPRLMDSIQKVGASGLTTLSMPISGTGKYR